MMKPVTSSRKMFSTNERGFSLVELMIALVLNSILIAGVVSIFSSNKKTYNTSDALGEVQETIRIAYDYMAREVRMAGSGFSCLSSVSSVENMLKDPTAFDFDFENVIMGYDNAQGLPQALQGKVKDGTDVLVVRGSYGTGAKLETEMPDNSAVLKTTVIDPPPFQDSDIIVITDCRSASIFQVTNYTDANGNIVHNTGGSTYPGNNTKNFLYPYQAGASVIKTRTVAYYIGTGASGEPALFERTTDKGSSETIEVVEGVQDMQMEFGEDINDDGYPDAYYTAAGVTKWNNVVSAKISLLVRSIDDNVIDTAVPYSFYGASVTPKDRHIYRSVTFVVAIRGRLQ